MPNHIHVLLSVDDEHAIGRAVQMIKGGFSHAMGRAGLNLKAVWQPNYYEHRVGDVIEYGRMRNYIHNNPVRRHLVARAAEYPYSSARTTRRLDEVPERLKPQDQNEDALTPAEGRHYPNLTPSAVPCHMPACPAQPELGWRPSTALLFHIAVPACEMTDCMTGVS